MKNRYIVEVKKTWYKISVDGPTEDDTNRYFENEIPAMVTNNKEIVDVDSDDIGNVNETVVDLDFVCTRKGEGNL